MTLVTTLLAWVRSRSAARSGEAGFTTAEALALAGFSIMVIAAVAAALSAAGVEIVNWIKEQITSSNA